MVQDFIFDGQSLSDLGYIAYWENTEDVLPVSTMDFETINGARTDISHRVSYNYNDNYSSTFKIMKNPCDFDDYDYLTNDDISEITRWLVRKQYKWFRFIDDDDMDEIWYQAQFKVNKESISDTIIGLEVTLETNAPYGFTPKQTISIESGDIIHVNSDEEGYIYPDMTITMTSGGTFILKNEYENRTTEIRNCVANEVITISGGDNLQITSSIEGHDFTNDFVDYNFPRLCNEYNNSENAITLSDNCKVTMTYRGIRKVGLK